MKKVIFIGLISLSMCLSSPVNKLAPPIHEQTEQNPNVPAPKAQVQPPPNAQQTSGTPTQVAESPSNQNTSNIQNPTSVQNKTNDKTHDNTPNANANEPHNDKKTGKEESKVEPSTNIDAKTQTDNNNNKVPASDETKPNNKANNETKPENKVPANDNTKPENKLPVNNTTKPADNTENKNDTTTQKNDAANKTTEAPKTEADKHNVVLQARGFDGPSFIGGIILTLGLLAIGFMGFKYYKAQTERNYHTL